MSLDQSSSETSSSESSSELLDKPIDNSNLTIVEKLYISNSVYRYGQIKYKKVLYTKSFFDDRTYDKLEKQYQQQYRQFKLTIVTPENRGSIKHPKICGTLAKFTEKNLPIYLNRLSRKKLDDKTVQFILTPKLDGCSIRIYIYKDKFLCLNREEQDFGTDITNKCLNIIKQINLPKFQEIITKCSLDLIMLRGELIIPTDKKPEEYQTVQSYITSQISQSVMLNCDCVFYECCPFKNDKCISTKFTLQLNTLNTTLPEDYPKINSQIISFNNISEQFLYEQFKSFNNQPYPCDGVVIKPDIIPYEEKLQPLYQIAYKFHQDAVQTIPQYIEWSVNQQFELVPTLIIEETKLGRKTVTKVGMSNLNKLIRNNIFQKIQSKQPILIQLSGGVVPQIVSEEIDQTEEQMKQIAEDNIPNVCPYCKNQIILKQSVDSKKNIQFKYVCKTHRCKEKLLALRFYVIFKKYIKKSKVPNLEQNFEKTYQTVSIEFVKNKQVILFQELTFELFGVKTLEELNEVLMKFQFTNLVDYLGNLFGNI